MPGLRSNLFALDPEPESIPQHERRRGPYSRRALGLRRSTSWTELALIVGVFCVAAVLLSGCVSTEFATDRVTVSRVSLFSDVNVEATMGADGSITVKERQAQTAVEAAISRIPGVTQ